VNPSADKILTSVMQEVSLHLKKERERERKKKEKRERTEKKKKKNRYLKQLLKDQDQKPALISRYKAKP
jgi:hypothetical protein